MAYYHPVTPNVSPEYPTSYLLRRYSWRTVLNLVGSIFLVSFYAFICFFYLNKSAVNGAIPSIGVGALWANYTWFIVSIFALEWARSGLGNLEASALMRSQFAPTTAMELMWHADGNWANVLYWLRGLRNLLCNTWLGKCLGKRRNGWSSKPGGLWWFLSFTSIVLFIAIPLSGLTMKLTTVSVYGTEKALILGSDPEHFNDKGVVNIQRVVRGKWTSGEPITPADGSIMYGPSNKVNVSAQYFEDEITEPHDSTPLQTFTGPAVKQAVFGNAWGIESNISCKQIRQNELQLMQIHGWDDYSLLTWGGISGSARFIPVGSKEQDNYVSLFVNETGAFSDMSYYSLVVAADGANYGQSPYSDPSNHDSTTVDSMRNSTPLDAPTSGLFEAFLWQGSGSIEDSVMLDLLTNTSDVVHTTLDDHDRNFGNSIDLAGFAIQCRLKSAVGNATLDPAQHTYSSFRRGTAAFSKGGDQDLYPIQIQAVEALGNYDQIRYLMTPFDATGPDSTWLATHLAIGLLPYTNASESKSITALQHRTVYHALTPQDLIVAFYKLFGHSIITMMGSTAQPPWKGDLYYLTSARTLKPGVVPWQSVLALLMFWTAIMVTTSIWMFFTKRWAPVLGGFEFFKFGAEYGKQISDFNHQRFQECLSLRTIPGMVGALPGDVNGGSEGFIGLSGNVASLDGTYVFDRKQAGKYRPIV